MGKVNVGIRSTVMLVRRELMKSVTISRVRHWWEGLGWVCILVGMIGEVEDKDLRCW